jgi:hypothetical protein
MQKFFVLVVLLGILALPLMAQDKVEVFGGYQYLHLSSDLSPVATANGWDAAVTGKFNKHIGVTGEFGGAYQTIKGVGIHIYTYTGGPVFSVDSAGKVNPFVHVLFGGARVSGSESGVSVSDSGYTMMMGGGLDLKVSKVVAVRLAQFDWVYYHFGSSALLPSTSSSGNVKIASGIVFRF